jgi:hypothetical protein
VGAARQDPRVEVPVDGNRLIESGLYQVPQGEPSNLPGTDEDPRFPSRLMKTFRAIARATYGTETAGRPMAVSIRTLRPALRASWNRA